MERSNLKTVNLEACIIGKQSVGKSSFLRRVREDRFCRDEMETMTNQFSKIFIRTDRFDFKIRVADVPGNRVQENLFFLEECNLIFLMYDLSRVDESFGPVVQYLDVISKNKNPDVTVVLFGLKRDLVTKVCFLFFCYFYALYLLCFGLTSTGYKVPCFRTY